MASECTTIWEKIRKKGRDQGGGEVGGDGKEPGRERKDLTKSQSTEQFVGSCGNWSCFHG